MEHILIIDNDTSTAEMERDYLEINSYEVTIEKSGVSGFQRALQEDIRLVLTELDLEDLNGFELCRELRNRRDIPIIIVSNRTDEIDKVRGLGVGADDYVVKPFDTDILLLRIAALLRRANIERSRTLTAGNLTMNKDEHTAYVNGSELALTVREFDLLYKLLSFPRKTFTRTQLMDEFWDYDSSTTSRTVDVYMSKLREKTSDCTGFEIVTVHGLGYKAVLK